MVLEAVQRLDLDAALSAMIGDKLIDMQAARAGGIGKCLWLTRKPEDKLDGVTVVRDFAEALRAL
jgi:histidinol phosphatase-like enzyme